MSDLLRPLKALADPVRLRILEFVDSPVENVCAQNGEVCACDLEKHLGLTQPTISHHMKILVDAGLVKATKRGRWVYYDLNRKAFASLLGALGRYRDVSAQDTRQGEGGR